MESRFGICTRDVPLDFEDKPPYRLMGDGELLVCGSDEGVRVLNPQHLEASQLVDGSELGELMSIYEHEASATGLCVFARGARFFDQRAKEFKGEAFEVPGFLDVGLSSPSGRYVAIPHENRIEVFDLANQEHEYVDRNDTTELCFTGEAEQFLVAAKVSEFDSQTDVWNLGARLSEFRYERSIEDRIGGPVAGVKGTNDVVYFTEMDVGDDECLCRVSLSDGEREEFAAHRFLKNGSVPKLYALAVSPSGAYTFASSGPGMFSVWRNRTSIMVHSMNGRSRERKSTAEVLSLVGWQQRFESPVQSIDTLPNDLGALLTLENGSVFFVGLAGLSIAECRVTKFGVVTTNPLQPTGQEIRQADYAPDGSLVTLTLEDGLAIFDPRTGREHQYVDDRTIFGAVFDRSSRGVTALGTSGTRHIAAATGKISSITPWHEGPRSSATERVASGVQFGDELAVIDAGSGAIFSKVKFDYVTARPLYSASEDGSLYAALGHLRQGSGIGVQILDSSTGTNRCSMPIEANGLCGLDFLKGNEKVVVGTPNGAMVIDTRRRRLIKRIPEPVEEPVILRFKRDHLFALQTIPVLVDG